MHKSLKTAAIYVVAAIFVAIGMYFCIKKDTYLAFAMPAVVGILLM